LTRELSHRSGQERLHLDADVVKQYKNDGGQQEVRQINNHRIYPRFQSLPHFTPGSTQGLHILLLMGPDEKVKGSNKPKYRPVLL
jgi:hypothetical protein